MTGSWRDLRADAVARLTVAGVGTAAVEARYLVEAASGSGPEEWSEIARSEIGRAHV